MAHDEDEDALFDRLERGLTAMRQDAELVRSGGVADLSAGLARIEAALHGLVAALEMLRNASDQQQARIARIEAAVASDDHDRQQLLQAWEALVPELHRQAAAPLAVPPLPPPQPAPGPAGSWIWRVALALVLILGGGMAGWILAHRERDLATAMHLWQARVSALTGLDFGSRHAPAEPVRATAQAEPPKLPPTPRLPPETPAPAVAVSPPPPPASPIPAPFAAATGSRAPSVAAPSAAVPMPPPSAQPVAATPSSAGPAVGAMAPARPVADAAPPRNQGQASAPAPGRAGTPDASIVPPARTEVAAASRTPASMQPAVGQPAAKPAAPQPGTPPLAASSPPGAGSEIVLRAVANTWVRVQQQDGPTLLRRILKTGETWQVPADPDLVLDTGNANGLVLEIDGRPTRLVRSKGDVVRGIRLDSGLIDSGAVETIGEAAAPQISPRGAAPR